MIVMTRPNSRLTFALLAGTALAGAASIARAVELPKGGSVAYGGVAISSPSANALAIRQSTPTAIVNWQSFSIGQGGRVDVAQPSSSSALLSRVTGSTPSTIAGQLNANGQVYLVNPNGIAITKTGTVNAGGFVASTLGIGDDDFVAGRRTFTGRGASAPVSNEGRITVAPGGYAALLGGSVDQAGTISVPMGKVGLGAGERATLDFSGDGFLQVAVPSSPNGSTDALIRHGGRTSAAGGRVEIQAATARDAARGAINLSGIVEARSVGGRSGAIVLGGGLGGAVTVTGRLDASARTRRTESAARRQPADGGSITVTGDAVRLAGAKLDAGGRNGGTIRVGGDKQGHGLMQTARTTAVDAATTIRADATGSGKGGSVVVWSDLRTDFAGTISARGGAQGGDGGFAEVSGKQLLNYTGLADLSAAKGHYGTLLLDPFNLFITAGPDSGIQTSNAGSTFFEANANDSVISATTIQNALATSNVQVSTGIGGTQAGDITVLTNIAWTAPTTLELSAARNIVIGNGTSITANISVPTSGTLDLRADSGSTGIGTVIFGTATGLGSVTANPGSTVNIYYNPTSYATPTNYTGNVAGGGTLTAFMLVNTPANLQNVSTNLAGTYALGTSIDASAAGAFTPIGSAATPFTGTFVGTTDTLLGGPPDIANLTINTPVAGAGLFGVTNGARIQGVTLTNANITGGDNTGALVGQATNSTIAFNTVSGAVVGQDTTGGIVGNLIGGALTGSISGATVRGTQNVGGIAGGISDAAVTTSSASGAVTGDTQVGGLIGSVFDSSITQSFARNPVVATAGPAGGLVGIIGGDGPSGAAASISQSFADGAVTAGTTGGGLVGLVSNNVQISDSYATGLVNGTTASGGLIGQLSTTVDPTNPSPGAGLQSTVTNTYATGYLIGPGTRGGLIGVQDGALQTIATSYWDTQTTGQATSAGGFGTGQTTAQLQGAFPAGFGAPVWGRQPADTYPYLTWLYPTGVIAPSGFVRDAAGAAVAGEPVRLVAGLTPSYQTNAGANGYYYLTRFPLLGAAPRGVTVYLDGTNRGSSTADSATGLGGVPNLDVRAGRALVRTGQATTSGIAALLAIAGDSAVSANVPYTVGTPAGTPTFAPSVALFVEATNPAGLTVDRSLVAAGAAQIAGAGSFTPAGPVTIAPGSTVQSTGGDVVIATSQFTNNAGATGVQAAGRYLIYSSDYAADTRGGLAGGNLYARSFIDSPAATIPGTASTFVYTRQPTLTFGAADGTRQYGTAPPAPTPTVAGFVNGDTAAVSYTGAPTITDTTSAATGVGTYPGAIQVAPGTLASTIGYAFAFTNAAVAVTPAPLTVQANNATKAYGNTLAFAGTEFTATGLRNTDTVASTTLASAGAPATATVAGSPYAITPSNAVGTGLGNYAITYAPGALAVTPAPLTVQANNASKVYGDALAFAGTEFTATGLRNADTVASTTLASAGAPAAATVAGSPYAITPSNAAGTGLGNYTITYAPGALAVTPAPLIVRANDVTKTYGNALAFAGTEFTATGLRNADTVASTTLASAGAPATATVAGSPYAIAVSNAAGTGLGNYAITYAPGALTVAPAPLIVQANDQAKVQGTAFAFAGTEFTTAGLRNTDAVTAATLASDGAAVTAAAAGSPYPIFVSNALGTGLANYRITYAPGQFTVTPAPVTPARPVASALTLALLGDTLSRQVPSFALPLYNPLDTIDVAGAGGGGQIVASATDTLSFVSSASTDLDASVASCEQTSQRRLRVYSDCVGTALERFADQLDSRSLSLPAPLRSVTGVIREAARRVRAARTIGEARAAVRVAVVAVRKAIALIRADEPAVARLQVRQGNVIASALQSVDNRLARAVGL